MIKKVQQKLPVKEWVRSNTKSSEVQTSKHSIYQVGTFHPWHSIFSALKQCCGSDSFHSSHRRSNGEKEWAGSDTVKSELMIGKHYGLYPVLESHSFKFKLENESSVAVYQKRGNWFCCSDTRLGLTWYAHLVHRLLAQPWKDWSQNRAPSLSVGASQLSSAPRQTWHTLPELATYSTIQTQATSQIQRACTETPHLNPNLNTNFISYFCKFMTFCLNVSVRVKE